MCSFKTKARQWKGFPWPFREGGGDRNQAHADHLIHWGGQDNSQLEVNSPLPQSSSYLSSFTIQQRELACKIIIEDNSSKHGGYLLPSSKVHDPKFQFLWNESHHPQLASLRAPWFSWEATSPQHSCFNSWLILILIPWLINSPSIWNPPPFIFNQQLGGLEYLRTSFTISIFLITSPYHPCPKMKIINNCP